MLPLPLFCPSTGLLLLLALLSGETCWPRGAQLLTATADADASARKRGEVEIVSAAEGCGSGKMEDNELSQQGNDLARDFQSCVTIDDAGGAGNDLASRLNQAVEAEAASLPGREVDGACVCIEPAPRSLVMAGNP